MTVKKKKCNTPVNSGQNNSHCLHFSEEIILIQTKLLVFLVGPKSGEGCRVAPPSLRNR